MTQMIAYSISVNGAQRDVTAHPDTPLLWVLREQLKFTGTKYGCGVGACGACTVHVNGQPVFSCLLAIKDMAGKSVVTIEGLSPDGNHPLQKAWVEAQAPQCGYCQPGQIMRAAGLLKENPRPTRVQIVDYMKTNICRCGSYNRIIAAIERVAKEG